MGDKKKQGAERRVALYRKYRSKSLGEIIGQEHITKTLSNAIKHGRISHAYLFTGPKGTGKTSIARILAHEVNNIPYTDESTHLDIIEIDAASNRRIDDIRDLREKVRIAPLSVKYKVYIIDEVHMLTTESFNALLKTLEEPPEHVIFILATTEVHKLPATIISRTQRHSFKSVPISEVSAHLEKIAKEEGIKISKGALNLLALHGNGGVRDSISLLDQLSTQNSEVDEKTVELLIGLAPKKQLEELLGSIESSDYSLVLKHVSDLIESGLTPSGVANQLAITIRDQAKAKSIDDSKIALLYDLLKVHGSSYPELTLESTLLKAASSNNAKTPKEFTKDHPVATEAEAKPSKSRTVATVVSAPKKIAKSALVEEKVKAEDSKPDLKKTKVMPSSFNISDKWPDILTEVKSVNNSLYTILRLAEPVLDNETLKLEFAFPFHKKRVDDLKNMNSLSQAISKVTGYDVNIETVVNKDVQPKLENIEEIKKSPNKDAHASVIDSVRDIMGGGEVIDG